MTNESRSLEPQFDVTWSGLDDPKQCLDLYKLPTQELLKLALLDSHPLYKFVNLDDHRMGIICFNVYLRNTDTPVYTVTFGDIDLET